jgi:hypothetical protein
VLRAYERLHDLRDESKFRSWFFATLLSIHRSRRRRRATVSLEEAWPRGGEPAGEDGSTWAEALERAHRAARALDGLAPVQREAVVLHEIERVLVVGKVAGLARVVLILGGLIVAGCAAPARDQSLKQFLQRGLEVGPDPRASQGNASPRACSLPEERSE